MGFAQYQEDNYSRYHGTSIVRRNEHDRFAPENDTNKSTNEGLQGDTRWNQHRLQADLKNFRHHELDIRDRQGVLALIQELRPDAIVHTAAQPSHDLAAKIPFDDFDTNAVGTINLLEATRLHTPGTVFVHMSTNKVYGDAPNELSLTEQAKRWDYASPNDFDGITEHMRIDQSKHSLFGASKVAADIMVQEYGRYFGMKTCCLRGGFLTGPNHSGVELHGFLSYLVKCNLEGKKYSVFGYKGKPGSRQYSFFRCRAVHSRIYRNHPRTGEVYNLGGGLGNSCSILEAFEMIEAVSGKKMIYEYVEKNREGDHICYISNLKKMTAHYHTWGITKTLKHIFEEIHQSWLRRTATMNASH